MSNRSAHALSGPEKAAVLLLALGSEESAHLLAGLGPREVALVSEQLARMRPVDEHTRRRVLRDFQEATARHSGVLPPDRGAAQSLADDSLELRQVRQTAGARHAVAPESTDEEAASMGQLAGDSIRPFDAGALDHLPRQSLNSRRRPVDFRLGLLGDMPVRCRARLADLSLNLVELRELQVGDVVLLGPASEESVELVGGNRCRLRGRLRSQGRCRAVELLDDRQERGEQS